MTTALELGDHLLPPELLDALAHAACRADRRARALDAENGSLGLVEWSIARILAGTGTAVAGTVRADVLAVDVDLERPLDIHTDAAMDRAAGALLAAGATAPMEPPVAGSDLHRRVHLARLAGDLVAAGLVPVVLRSGRQGNRHLFCTIRDPAAAQQFADQARAGGLDVRHANALIRPPGWPHRLGHTVSVASIGSQLFTSRTGTERTAWWTVVRSLTDAPRAVPVAPVVQPLPYIGTAAPPNTPRTHRAGATPPVDPLPDRLWRLIRYGDSDRRYQREGRTDYSSLTLVICNLAFMHELHPDRVWHLLCDPRNVGGTGLRRRVHERDGRRSDGRAWFDRLWTKAADGAARRRPFPTKVESIERIIELDRLACRSTFPGVAGSTDRAVLKVCHQLGSSYGSLRVPLATRAVGVQAGVTKATAGRALKRLRTKGWLVLIRTSREDRSAVYQLTAPPGSDLPVEILGELLPFEEREDTASNSAVGGGPGTADIAHSSTSDTPTGGVGLLHSCAKTGELPGEDRPLALDGAFAGPLRGLAGHDAFHRLALGKGCLETLSALDDETWLSTAAIARTTGKHAGSVRRHLEKLRQVGLIEQGPGRRSRRVDLHQTAWEHRLHQTADASGTLGTGEHRARVFADERREYRVWLTVQQAEHAAADVALSAGGSQPQLPVGPIPTRRTGVRHVA